VPGNLLGGLKNVVVKLLRLFTKELLHVKDFHTVIRSYSHDIYSVVSLMMMLMTIIEISSCLVVQDDNYFSY